MNLLHKDPKTTPRDFFMYLGVMAALYISTVSIIALWFKIIDEIFKDPLAYSDPYSTGISLAIASLIVIFPLFIVISWLIRKDEKKHSEKLELGIRKWLIYLTLFVAGLVIAVDLITLLNTFLSGEELTARFVLKVFVILVVIGAIFAYYIYKLRDAISDKAAKYLTWGVALFVAASIIGGFVIMGSPYAQRMKRLDAERVSNLQNIQWQIVNYWQSKESLPTELVMLEDEISGYKNPTDPETEEPYEYHVTDALSFELCGTFALSSEEYDEKELYRAVPTLAFPVDGNWRHDAGRYCFERTIDPDMYPPFKELR